MTVESYIPAKTQVRADRIYNEVKESLKSHENAASWYTRRSRYLTLVIVTVNALLSSAIFTSAGGRNSISVGLQYIAGTLSVVLAVLTAWKSVLNYDSLATLHDTAYKKYFNLKSKFATTWELQQVDVVHKTESGSHELSPEWDELLKELRRIKSEEPNVREDLRKTVPTETLQGFVSKPGGEPEERNFTMSAPHELRHRPIIEPVSAAPHQLRSRPIIAPSELGRSADEADAPAPGVVPVRNTPARSTREPRSGPPRAPSRSNSPVRRGSFSEGDE